MSSTAQIASDKLATATLGRIGHAAGKNGAAQLPRLRGIARISAMRAAAHAQVETHTHYSLGTRLLIVGGASLACWGAVAACLIVVIR